MSSFSVAARRPVGLLGLFMVQSFVEEPEDIRAANAAGSARQTWRVEGMLTVGRGAAYSPAYSKPTYSLNIPGQRGVAGVTDGLSTTVAVIEDVSRGYFGNVNGTYTQPGGGATQIARWAEPDQANGASGPPTDSSGTPCYEANGGTGSTCNSRKPINNNPTPLGGPAGCLWSTNNCGPNDEPFSFHTGGALAVFGDGHVAFIRDSIDMTAFRYLCTPASNDITPDY